MDEEKQLLPEVSKWNHGRGISPSEWICISAKSDMAVGFSLLFWPKFEPFEGYVLLEGFSLKNVREWEAAPNSSRQLVESHVNEICLDDWFRSEAWSPLLDARRLYLIHKLADVYTLKLASDFPDRTFKVSMFDGSQDDDSISLSFWQV